MKTHGRWFVMPIAIAMVSIFGFFGVMHAEAGIPQDVATASSVLGVKEEFLLPVVDSGSGATVGWKVEASSQLNISLNGLICADFVSSTSSISGTATVQYSKIHDWARAQITPTAVLNTNNATIYWGKCGNIVELAGVINAEPSLRLRRGPGTGFPIVGSALNGMSVYIHGVSSDGKWYFTIPLGERGAWMSAAFVTVTGDVSTLPVVDVIAP